MAAAANTRQAGSKPRGQRKPREVVQTWSFDSAGPKKYALQIQRASNGNPCLRIVEGTPQEDGSYRKFDLTIWSEDFDRLFNALDAARAYIAEHGIRTPPGHKYEPRRGGRQGGG